MKSLFAAIAGVILALAGAPAAMAQNVVNITEGTFEPMPTAIPDFSGDSPEEARMGEQIAGVVRSDLQNSGLFRMIDKAAFIEKTIDIAVLPRFADWKVLKTEALVVGKTIVQPDGRMSTQFRLYDVFNGKQLYAQEYTVPSGSDNWRKIAHIIADDVYEQLTPDGPYFDSRIVFIAESGDRSRRTRRLAIMDQDGANPEYLTDGKVHVEGPRFNPTSQTIIYNALVPDRNNPRVERRRVYLLDIGTGRQEVIGEFGASSFAARFSPDGRSVVMSLAQNGNVDLYLLDLARRERTRLTTDPNADTSPSFSPDGKHIVFTSDRGGSPQLYVMNADGSPVQCPSGGSDSACRITFNKGYYSTPVWSPRGDLIAFTRQVDGQFEIGVLKPDGTGERTLTQDFHMEGPTWSPNGRVLMFFKEARGGWPSLWSIDLTGRNLRKVPTPGYASDPAWSPVLN